MSTTDHEHEWVFGDIFDLNETDALLYAAAYFDGITSNFFGRKLTEDELYTLSVFAKLWEMLHERSREDAHDFERVFCDCAEQEDPARETAHEATGGTMGGTGR